MNITIQKLKPAHAAYLQDDLSALCVAARNGHNKVVQALMNAKADLNSKDTVSLPCTHIPF